MKRSWKFTTVTTAVALLAVAGCKSQQAEPVTATDAAAPLGGTTGGSTGTGADIPALVSVNLQNVLNDLSVSLQVNRNNIPVTAQVPIDVAASVCGVSVSALAASVASGKASCTATTTSAQLSQAVQQQIASGGNVTGGDQTMGAPTGNQI